MDCEVLLFFVPTFIRNYKDVIYKLSVSFQKRVA